MEGGENKYKGGDGVSSHENVPGLDLIDRVYSHQNVRGL